MQARAVRLSCLSMPRQNTWMKPITEMCQLPDRTYPRLVLLNGGAHGGNGVRGAVMRKTGSASFSEDVLELVHTVERLTAEDQERILRIVSLLTRVPSAVQRETQRRLKSLVERDPHSMFDCVNGVDDVIEYLENCILAVNEPMGRERFFCLPGSRRRN